MNLPLIRPLLLGVALSVFSGCATKVVSEDSPSMESIYFNHSGGSDEADLAERQQKLKMRDQMATPTDYPNYDASLPAHPERMRHLYPKLPNPELYLYVFPHAVGEAGAVIPGYYTRFPMYERDHYALPGETVETVRRNEVVNRALAEVAREEALREADETKPPQRRHDRPNSNSRGGQ